MKTFELTAAGGCVVSNYSDEQAEFFAPGHGMAYFDTRQEMTEKVADLLADKQKNRLIRTNAILQAMDHSYHQRVKELLAILKNI
jgi:spore maturation protein CgeB